MFGTVKSFERRFRTIEGGYLYFPTRWSRGYLIAPEEFGALYANWRRAVGWQGMIAQLAVLVLAVALLTLVGAATGASAVTMGSLLYAIAAAYVAWFIWVFAAPYRLVRNREPVAPRRSKWDLEIDLANQLTWPLAAFVVVLSAWFVFLSAVIAWANPLIGVPVFLLFAWASVRNLRIVHRKWMLRRSEADRL